MSQDYFVNITEPLLILLKNKVNVGNVRDT
jgi:hypothetical protein